MSDEKDFYVDPAVLAESIQRNSQRLETEQSAGLAELPAAKANILNRLKDAGIDGVEILYDGEGDEGQIGEIWRLDAKQKRLELLELSEEGSPDEELMGALDEFAWELLAAYHEGYEIDDGGEGRITIDVATGRVRLVHTDRMIVRAIVSVSVEEV